MNFLKNTSGKFSEIRLKREGCFKTFILTLGVLLSYCCGVSAKIIIAANGTTAGVQAAVNLASAISGDTVKIPAGTFSYSGSVTFNAGINIIGAGKDSTVINKTGSSTAAMFIVAGGNGLGTTMGSFTVSGVTGPSSTLQDNGIRLNNCANFHVRDIIFKNFGFSAVYANGNSFGVIRNCSFLDIFRPAINNLGYGVAIYGDKDASWAKPLNLGGTGAVYIEDCFFNNNRHAIVSNDGGRYVFRYNMVAKNAGNWQAVDAHGREYGSARGARSYEIYNNVFDDSVTTLWATIMIRGGDGVIFNNNLLRGTGTDPILLANRTDGSHTSTTYPAPDQTRNLYVWNNRRGNGDTINVSVRPGHEAFFQLGRDYFNEEKPGYTPYTYPYPFTARRTPAIANDTLSDGQSSNSYSDTLRAFGGTAPYSWSVLSGSLPAGLTLDSGGVISGIPTKSQTAVFTVEVTDADSGQNTKEFAITVKNPAENNLINAAALFQHCGWFNPGNPLQAMWDGDVSGAAASSPGSGTVDSVWVEFDFGDIYTLSRVRLFGDADGSWVSETFSVLIKTSLYEPWTRIVHNTPCFGNRWYESETTENARYMRLSVKGNPIAGSVQIRAFEAYGEL